MRVQVKVSDNTFIAAEADNPLDLFRQLSSLSEVFGEQACRKCGGSYTYRVRGVGEGKKQFTYPELQCTNMECRAKLSFGHSDDGALFPKRYKQHKEGEDTVYTVDENGKKVVKGTWGWATYNKDSGEED